MPLFLRRNDTDFNQIEVLIQSGEEVILCGLIFVDAVEEGAVGELKDIADCIRGKKRVVLMLKEEWNAIQKSRSLPAEK